MSVQPEELQNILDFTIRIARDAGEITMQYFGSVKSQRKADGSFVTQADYESERYLRSQIRGTFPNDSIIGEEEDEYQGSSERRWILDPLDGTFSFIHGVPLYGVLIGLEIKSKVILGVVNMPAIDELLYAAQGCGCFFNERRMNTSPTKFLNDALLLSTDFGVNPDCSFEESSRKLQSMVAARRTWGDCYGHVLVATGRADIMLDPVMKVWDCAALLPIMEEAGGTFTDWHGNRTIYSGNALSTNGLLFEDVMKVINGTSADMK